MLVAGICLGVVATVIFAVSAPEKFTKVVKYFDLYDK